MQSHQEESKLCSSPNSNKRVGAFPSFPCFRNKFTKRSSAPCWTLEKDREVRGVLRRAACREEEAAREGGREGGREGEKTHHAAVHSGAFYVLKSRYGG
eukprot:276355-Rhodomonas_salina.1